MSKTSRINFPTVVFKAKLEVEAASRIKPVKFFGIKNINGGQKQEK
jgi:hypothetical protein